MDKWLKRYFYAVSIIIVLEIASVGSGPHDPAAHLESILALVASHAAIPCAYVGYPILAWRAGYRARYAYEQELWHRLVADVLLLVLAAILTFLVLVLAASLHPLSGTSNTANETWREAMFWAAGGFLLGVFRLVPFIESLAEGFANMVGDAMEDSLDEMPRDDH